MKTTIFALLTSLMFTTAYAQPIADAKTLIQSAMEQAKHIHPETLKKALEKDEKLVLLDVRQTGERGILGLIRQDDISIPRGYLEIRAYKKVPDLNANVVVYCGKGIRSAFAANTLTSMGYKNVRSLKGGVTAWLNSGFTTFEP